MNVKIEWAQANGEGTAWCLLTDFGWYAYMRRSQFSNIWNATAGWLCRPEICCRAFDAGASFDAATQQVEQRLRDDLDALYGKVSEWLCRNEALPAILPMARAPVASVSGIRDEDARFLEEGERTVTECSAARAGCQALSVAARTHRISDEKLEALCVHPFGSVVSNEKVEDER